jgi:hypothetical protein
MPASPADRDGADATTLARPPLSRMFPAAPLLPVAGHARGATSASGTARQAVDASQAANGGSPDETRRPAGPEGTVQFPALDQSGIVAFRRRQDQATDEFPSLGLSAQQPPDPFASSPAGSAFDATPSPGPGYRGPRYRGFPPQYQPAPASDAASAEFRAGAGDAAETSQPELSDARQVSSFGRPRRTGPGAHEAAGWPQGDHAATDTAV